MIVDIVYTAIHSLVMRVRAKLELMQGVVHGDWGLRGQERERLIHIRLLVETSNARRRCVVLGRML